MSINKNLAKAHHLNEATIGMIEDIHKELSNTLLNKVQLGFKKEVYNYIEQKEFELQWLWGFPQDPSYHTWKNRYEFKCQWVNRTFLCKDTGIELTILNSVEECTLFVIGNGWLDVGRLNAYSRRGGNIEEVKSEG